VKTRSKTGRKKGSSRAKPRARRGANPIDDALARLERDIPRLLRQLRNNVQKLQGQVDQARADGDQRWRDAERKVKKDAAMLRAHLKTRLESAIGRIRGEGKPAKSKASRTKAAATRGAKKRARKRSA